MLRYVGRITEDGEASVALTSVPLDDALCSAIPERFQMAWERFALAGHAAEDEDRRRGERLAAGHLEADAAERIVRLVEALLSEGERLDDARPGAGIDAEPGPVRQKSSQTARTTIR